MQRNILLKYQMDIKYRRDDRQQFVELMHRIEGLMSDVQDFRLANELSKLSQVRLVDLQYSAKLVLEQLAEHLEKEEKRKDCV